MSKNSKTLEIGCGLNKTDGAIGVDFNINSKADIIHDLNIFPYPFEDNSFDTIICNSIIEHLDNFIKVMEELHRIGINGCLIKITVPFFMSWTAHTDPTHKKYFTSRSFDYFDETKDLSRYKYSESKFIIEKIVYKKICNGIFKYYDKLFLLVANRFKYFFEQRLTFLFAPEDIYFELIVSK